MRKYISRVLRLAAGALAALLLLPGCGGALRQALPAAGSTPQASQTAPAAQGPQTKVWFFDVGQGDSALVQTPDGANLLIDAGTPESADGLVARLQQLGVKKLDVVLATHPHADHIGGMHKVLERFAVGDFYMPRVAAAQVPTTKTYTRMLQTLQKKGIKAKEAYAGQTAFQSGDCRLELLAPVKGASYEDLNDYSIVARLRCGDKGFLFTGDASKASEAQMCAQQRDKLPADLLKCGHHGSNTASTEDFLDAVHPRTTIISCGRDNSYGLPTQKTLRRLQQHGVEIHRTDEERSILVSCDGSRITLQTGLPSVTGD